ncbi:MAG: hypothetical protein JWO57_4556 [Pseudonocardiales bacterium]|nr:hypothetical protein [Pseudonocardiales bacterium]
MGTAVLLIVALLLPSGIGFAAVLVVRWLRWLAAQRHAAPDVPVERLRSDLRRLHAQLERTESATGLPAKNLRCAAVRAAYVDALSTACRRVGVPPPVAVGNAPVPITEIYRVEAALRGQGLDVREAH